MTKPSHTDGHLHREFIRKYVAYAKRTVHPNLDEEAKKHIIEYYVSTRKQSGNSKIRSLLLHVPLKHLLDLLKRVHEFDCLKLPTSRMLSERPANEDMAVRSMGENFDETAIASNQKGKARHAERSILDIVDACLRMEKGSHNLLMFSTKRNVLTSRGIRPRKSLTNSIKTVD